MAQNYQPSTEILALLEDFRLMINDSIRIGLDHGVTSRNGLSSAVYHQLTVYQVPSAFKVCAVSCAARILRNYRRALRRKGTARRPYARRRTLTTCYAFKVEGGDLKLFVRPRSSTSIALNKHVLRILTTPGIEIRSVALTESKLSVCYSKDVASVEPVGTIGVDTNLTNVTTADSAGRIERYDLSQATEIRMRCRETKSHLMRYDARVRKKIFQKYGRIEKDRVNWILHNVSSSIVKQAKENYYAVALEKLTDLRRLYRKGNWRGPRLRALINSWGYGRLRNQIEYKARWEGLPVIYVDPRGTSANCSTCGSKMHPNGQRTLFCQKCSVSVDRDINAARNILAKGGLRFGLDGRGGEAMKWNPTTAVIPGADASQSSLQGNA